MKKKLILFITMLVSIYPVKNTNGSELSVLIDKVKGNTICKLKFFQAIPGMVESCSKTTDIYKFDIIPNMTGRWILREKLGCGYYAYDARIDPDDPTKVIAPDGRGGRNEDKHVALLGDSLTMFGGDSSIWDQYLGGGAYHVLELGAAGATSSAWKEHFETCIKGEKEGSKHDPWIGLGQPKPNIGYGQRGYGRPQLPPRSIMMIGGNDFHAYKGMLQAMWWAVPFRRLNTVYNVEKVITYHHQGNDGCGDYFRVTENGKKRLDPNNPDRMNDEGNCIDTNGSGGEVDHEDWGIGRLFVLLGNIPAVSLDPTVVPGYYSMLQRLGLYDKPHDDIVDKENIKQAELYGDALAMAITVEMMEGMIGNLLARYGFINLVNYQNCGVLLKDCSDNTWASRQMFKLQFTLNAMNYIRKGFPYIHMYSFFRDKNANDRGCWWCADRGLWMKDEGGYNHVVWSSDDGIHLNHINGYLRWGTILTPFMGKYGMDQDTRLGDDFEGPGGEVVVEPGCDDLCLYILCIMTGYCKP